MKTYIQPVVVISTLLLLLAITIYFAWEYLRY